MTDIIIIGGGPAGLTAGIYAARAQKSVLIFERESFGGQIVNTPLVENYPALPGISGYDFSMALKAQAVSFGCETKREAVRSVEKNEKGFMIKTRKNEYEAKAVILALGASPRKLGLDNEDMLIGSGVSFCATCDGAFFKNKTVAVVGGGETAVTDAIYLSDICEKVYLIHRRDEFRASAGNINKLKSLENIELLTNKTISALKGGFSLEGIFLKSKENGEETYLSVNALFEAVGQIPSTDIVKDLCLTDSSGYIVAGEDCKTNVPGLFAAGDCRTKTLRQLTTAASDGSIAATAAVEYLSTL